MPELIRVAEGVAIPPEMLTTWDRLSELAAKYGPVFEADLGRLGLGLNLRPIYNLNTSIGGNRPSPSAPPPHRASSSCSVLTSTAPWSAASCTDAAGSPPFSPPQDKKDPQTQKSVFMT